VLEDPPNAVFIPSCRKPRLAHGFLLRRRRKARLAFGPSGYAVIKNTDLGAGSGTYMTRRYRPARVWPRATRDPSRLVYPPTVGRAPPQPRPR
jgi:hypothetical protein